MFFGKQNPLVLRVTTLKEYEFNRKAIMNNWLSLTRHLLFMFNSFVVFFIFTLLWNS
jgi:hypothetical protein